MTPQGLQLIKRLPQIWRNTPWWRKREEQPDWVKGARAVRQKLMERQFTALVKRHVPAHLIDELVQAHFPDDTTVTFTVSFVRSDEMTRNMLRRGWI